MKLLQFSEAYQFGFSGGAEPREAKLGAPERRAARADHCRGLREPGKAETWTRRRGGQKAADSGES